LPLISISLLAMLSSGSNVVLIIFCGNVPLLMNVLHPRIPR
jgi:hypothetical protein